MKNVSSKINQLVLSGLLAEDQKLFINRLSLLISRGNSEILEQLANGVVTSVSISDMEGALDWVKTRNKEWDILEVTSVEPTSDPSCVRVSYKYLRTKWFPTSEKADRFSRGYCEDGVSESDESHQFKGTYKSSSSDNASIDNDWLKVEIL